MDIYYAYREMSANIFNDTLNIVSNDPVSEIKKVYLTAKTYRRFEVPEQFSTIQSGIDRAWDGDTVLVSPGIYFENLMISGKSIALISHYYMTLDTSYISNTVIANDTNKTVITIDSV